MNRRPEESDSTLLRDALRFLGRWKWLILAFVVLMTGASLVLSITRAPSYTATAELKYERPVDISNPLANSSYIDPQQVSLELQSVASEINGPPVKDRAAAQLNLSPADKRLKASAEATPNSSVVRISAVSDTPRGAAAVANAFSAGFIANNQQVERERLAQAIEVVQEKLKAFTNPVTHTSPDYILLSQRLSDLQIADATVTGDYRLISAAVPPTSKSSPQPVRDTVFGLVIGLLGGFAAAVVLEQLSTKLRSDHEVGELLELPVIGRVPRLRKGLLAKSPLVVLHEPWGGPAESFRVLRNNLDFLARDTELCTILVTSGLPGEGKSVMISNLALAVAMGGKRVVVVDGNLRQPSLHRIFSLSNDLGLSTVVGGEARLVDALKQFELPLRGELLPRSPGGSGDNPETPPLKGPMLSVLTSGEIPNDPGEVVASRRFDSMLRDLKKSSVDLVLIDSPAVLEFGDAAAMAATVDAVLLVVDMESASKLVLAEAHESLDKLPCHKLGVIAVRQHRDREWRRHGYHQETAAAKV